MAKFVKNPSGTVHSVDDNFTPLSGEEFAEEWAEGKWAVVTEADASPQLLGEGDPAVDFHVLREPAEEADDIEPVAGGVVPVSPEGTPAVLDAGEIVTSTEEAAQ